MGVSVFTDHLLEATGLSRLGLANAYLVGTVLSGLLLPFGGTLFDRWGARPLGLIACVGLALTLGQAPASPVARDLGVDAHADIGRRALGIERRHLAGRLQRGLEHGKLLGQGLA